MERDVARLRQLNQDLYEQCVIVDTGSGARFKLNKDMVPYGKNIVSYSIRYDNCRPCLKTAGIY